MFERSDGCQDRPTSGEPGEGGGRPGEDLARKRSSCSPAAFPSSRSAPHPEPREAWRPALARGSRAPGGRPGCLPPRARSASSLTRHNAPRPARPGGNRQPGAPPCARRLHPLGWSGSRPLAALAAVGGPRGGGRAGAAGNTEASPSFQPPRASDVQMRKPRPPRVVSQGPPQAACGTGPTRDHPAQAGASRFPLWVRTRVTNIPRPERGPS